MRSEEGEKAVVVGQIRKRVSVAIVRAQCHSLLGRLEVIGPGSPAAAGMRRFADEQERRWRRERQAIVLVRDRVQILSGEVLQNCKN